jgi:hypothetical protein
MPAIAPHCRAVPRIAPSCPAVPRIAPLCRTLARIALLCLVAAAPGPIGFWRLACRVPGHCLLRYAPWILAPGGSRPGAALEVQRRGGWLVPVVTLQGASTQALVGGLLALHPRVRLRFTPGTSVGLSCGLDEAAVICAPVDPAAAAAALPPATSVRVDLLLRLPDGAALPPQGATLALSGTQDALAKLRAAGAAGEALPAEPGLDWIGFLDKLMRTAGFSNATAGLLLRLAGR